MKLSFKLDPSFSKNLAADLKRAMELTMEEIKDNLVTSQTMPYRDGIMNGADIGGTLQGGNAVSVYDGEKIIGYLSNEVEYARYLYYGKIRHGTEEPYDYHGQINFNRGKNPYARDHWLEPYEDITYLNERFAENLKKVREGG